MDGYIQTAIGVAVSVTFFMIGYRQTIGARKERVASANRAVYRALLRRLVLENYAPKVEDLNRLVEGKAHEFRVSSGDLQSDEKLLSQVFAEIFDNDFIAPEKRTEIELRVSAAFEQLNKGKQRLDESRFYVPDITKKKRQLVGALAVLASLLGAVSSLVIIIGEDFPSADNITAFRTFAPIITVFIASLVSVVTISFVKKLREAPEELPSRVAAAAEGALLVHKVATLLAKHKIPFEVEPKIGLLRPDFVIDLGTRRVAIETKSWRIAPPPSVIARTLRYLQILLKDGAVDQAILVTHERVPQAKGKASLEDIEFVAMKDLSEWLRNQRKITNDSSKLTPLRGIA